MVRLKTYEGYEPILRMVEVPWLGHVNLRGITPFVPHHHISDRLESGLSARSAVHTHQCLHRVFEEAVRWGMLPRNPCDNMDPTRPRRVLTKEQVATFLEATRDHRYPALYVLAVAIGMRIS
jgi:integrase